MKRVPSEADYQSIESLGTPLNDTIINAAHNMVRNQFHAIGLYDTSLGDCLTYPRAQSFHQIIQEGDHWTLITSINGPNTTAPTVRVYDSNFHGKLSASVQKQAAAILRTQAPEIIFSIESVQQHPLIEESGVFVVVDLMFGIDPTQVTYDHVELRPLLCQCLKNETFPSKFPRLKGTYSHSLPYD